MSVKKWLNAVDGGGDSCEGGPVSIGRSKERGSGGLVAGWERGSHEENLRLAEERGVKPISFKDLKVMLEGRGLGGPEDWILFDTPPKSYGTSRGNHWRVLAVDSETGAVMLQPCSQLGTYDLELEPEVVHPEENYFTGVAVQRFEDSKGRQFSLHEVAKLGYQKAREVFGELARSEVILWSTENGLRDGSRRLSIDGAV